jgi:hypothetical protein
VYFAIMKITFSGGEGEESAGAMQGNVKQELNALTEKLRARFRVAILPGQLEDGELPSLGIASLAHSEEALARQLDAICEFCESSGFGRIESERTLMDHIDAFGDDEEEDSDADVDEDIDEASYGPDEYDPESDPDDDDDDDGKGGGSNPGPRTH